MRLFNQIGLLEKDFVLAAPMVGATRNYPDNNPDNSSRHEIMELDVSNVKNGVYFLKIETLGKPPVTKKLVVSRKY